MEFLARYNNLNTKQKEAVNEIYWPVLVIAGPWSGKTELLAVRIANILKQTDANASNILCLTFTDNAAKNMRDRLKKIIGTEAYKVAIHTFHTFGLEILNRYKYKLNEDNELNPIDDISKSQIFHKIISELPWNHTWKKQSTIHTVFNAINELKNSWISPEDFEEILNINEQILNDISSKISEWYEKINLLWRKKDDLLKKVELFKELAIEIGFTLEKHQKYYKFHETLAKTIFTSMQETALLEKSPAITKWKDTWLEKNYKWIFILKDIEKMKKSWGLLEIYKKYSEELKNNSFIDFSDMIIRANKLLEENDDVRVNISEQYQWILIDEYQDTNDAQLSLITNITKTTDFPNIFAVGDDDQSIYKFQGANTKNIKIFKNTYPETKLIILDTNYRSYKEIIDFSRSIISSHNNIESIFPGTKKEFFAHRGNGWIIKQFQFNTELWEIEYISQAIKNIIKSEENNKNFSLSDIAIISRRNSTLENIGKFLLTQKIPVQLSRDENIFDDEVIILLVQILTYIYSLKTKSDRDDLLVEILSHPIWNIHRLDLWEISRKIYNAKNQENKVWIEELRKHPSKNISKIAHFFIELTILSNIKRLEEIIDIILGSEKIQIPEDYTDEISQRDQIKLYINNEEIEFSSPLFDYFFSEKRLKENPLAYSTHLSNVRKIIDSLRCYRKNKTRLKIEDFTEYIELIDKYWISLTTSSLIGSPDAIQCITAHKSKWLEYKYVFAIGLTEKNYEKSRNFWSPFPSNLVLSPEKDNTDDIERLIYTICTRAKDFLSLSYSVKWLDEKSNSLVSVLWWLDWWVKNEQLSNNNYSEIIQQQNKDIISLPFTGDEEKFLKNIITSKFSFSATSIQNFLNVADGWPSRYLSRNIIQFPQNKSDDAIYGSAIHKALEEFFKDFKIKKTFNKSLLEKHFTEYLLNEWMSEESERLFLKRGKDNLESLYPLLIKQKYGEIHLEHRFNLEWGWAHLDNIRLTGVIDRIEITKDNKLIITDYKTGAWFSDLWGYSSGYEAIKKWKYDLQLTFYAILFEEAPRWNPWPIREFELQFVEADRKTGEYYNVKKYPQRGEIDRLKKLIKIIAQHIKNLDFPDISQYTPDIKWIRQFEEDLLEWRI